MNQYRFVGLKHADELADGRPVAYGDTVDLKDDQVKANKRLIDDGLLLLVGEKTTRKRRQQESDK